METSEKKQAVPIPEVPEKESGEKQAEELPSFDLLKIMDSIGDSLEKEMPQYSGVIYLLGFLSVIFVNTILAWHAMPEMPGIEFLFLVFFISFPLNYILLRINDIDPYLLNAKENLLAKVSAFLIIGAVIFMLYSLEYGYPKWTMFIIASSWLIAMIFENIFIDQQFFHFEILASAGMLLGAYFVQGISFENFDFALFSISTLLALLAAILFASFIIVLLKLNKKNCCGVLAHYVHVVLLLFFPIFMPFLGKVIAPNWIQWLIIILCGLFNLKAGGFFFRSIQLQSHMRSRRILVVINIAVVAFFIYEIIANLKLDIFRIGACIIMLAGTVFLIKRSPSYIEVEPSFETKIQSEAQKPLLNLK